MGGGGSEQGGCSVSPRNIQFHACVATAARFAR